MISPMAACAHVYVCRRQPLRSYSMIVVPTFLWWSTLTHSHSFFLFFSPLANAKCGNGVFENSDMRESIIIELLDSSDVAHF